MQMITAKRWLTELLWYWWSQVFIFVSKLQRLNWVPLMWQKTQMTAVKKLRLRWRKEISTLCGIRTERDRSSSIFINEFDSLSHMKSSCVQTFQTFQTSKPSRSILLFGHRGRALENATNIARMRCLPQQNGERQLWGSLSTNPI